MKKRMTLMFRGPLTIHNGWIDGSYKVAVCYECACSAYGEDRIESEIAMGRLSFKSHRPLPQAEQMALPLTEEKVTVMAKTTSTDTQDVTAADVAAVESVFGGAVAAEYNATDVAAAKSAGVSLEVYYDMHPVLKMILTDDTYLEGNDQFSFAAQLLTIGSLDELMSGNASQDVLHGEDHEGEPFMLYGVRYRPGDKNPEVPVFAIFDVSFDGGLTRQVLSTSAFNAMVKAKVLKERDAFPRYVVLKQKADKTRSGYYPVDLVDATQEDIDAAASKAKASEGF